MKKPKRESFKKKNKSVFNCILKITVLEPAKNCPSFSFNIQFNAFNYWFNRIFLISKSTYTKSSYRVFQKQMHFSKISTQREVLLFRTPDINSTFITPHYKQTIHPTICLVSTDSFLNPTFSLIHNFQHTFLNSY